MNAMQLWAIIYAGVFLIRFGARFSDWNNHVEVPTFTTGQRLIVVIADALATLPLVGSILRWW